MDRILLIFCYVHAHEPSGAAAAYSNHVIASSPQRLKALLSLKEASMSSRKLWKRTQRDIFTHSCTAAVAGLFWTFFVPKMSIFQNRSETYCLFIFVENEAYPRPEKLWLWSFRICKLQTDKQIQKMLKINSRRAASYYRLKWLYVMKFSRFGATWHFDSHALAGCTLAT